MSTKVERTTQELERRLVRLYDQERELQNHPNYPCISEIPGYLNLQDEIDKIESELADRECWEFRA